MTHVSPIQIGKRTIGVGQPALVIAEVAQAHDGSLGLAHAFIDAVADTGADAVKFQTHIAAAESTPAEPWRVKFSRQDTTRYEYWRRMEFTTDQWAGLKAHADQCGLLFLSSPFSLQAGQLLQDIGIPAWKVASGEVSNPELTQWIIDTGMPVLMSTGMSEWTEIDRAVERFRQGNVPFALLQCTSAYPCPAEKVGVNVVAELRDRYGCPAGLSDHSGVIYPCLAATALGAEVLEVHVTLSREMFGPDVPVSLTTTELRQLVEGVRFVETMSRNPVDKQAAAGEMSSMRKMFTRSVVARRNLPAGTLLAATDLALKKPGTGIPGSDLPRVIGSTLRCGVTADGALAWSDLVEGHDRQSPRAAS